MGEPLAGTTSKSLSCEECRELLSDYLDRELTGEERTAVEQHLGTCLKCGTESTRLAGLKQVMQHWDGVKGSGEFRREVMQKMIHESQQVPSAQFTQAASQAVPPAAGRTLSPVWILLGAAVLAAIAYILVRAL